MSTGSLPVSRGWLHSLKIAALVGTLLTSIHQAQAIQHLSFQRGDVFRLVLNYLVPFLVASYARGWRPRRRAAVRIPRGHDAVAEYGIELGAEFTVEHVRDAHLGRRAAGGFLR